MLLIGLLILVAAAAFAGVLISENWGGGTFAIKGFGHVLGHYTLAQIFISGIVLTAIFFFGLWAASVSTRIRRRASNRRRAESRTAREEHDELVAERDNLARELATAKRNEPVAAPVAAVPVATAPVAAAPVTAPAVATGQPVTVPAAQPVYAPAEQPNELLPTRQVVLDEGPLMREVEV
ncbi:MAG TPA: hypothetical protein VGL75_18560 [Acidothermaceae bacterium]|jgi:uncharacterized membrane protein